MRGPLPASHQGRRRLRLAAIALSLASLAAGHAWAATATAPELAYVPISAEGAVYVLDMAQRQVTDKISGVGEHPTVLRALPDHSKIYVDNFGTDLAQIAVIDAATHRVLKKIETQGAPFASIQMSADGHYLYVPTNDSILQVIDTREDRVVHSFQLPDVPYGVDVSPDGRTFYIVYSDDTIGAYATGTGLPTLPRIGTGGKGSGWSVVSRDGRRIYVLNLLSNDVSVIDSVAWRNRGNISMGAGAGPVSGGLSPDGRHIAIANVGTHDVQVIDDDSGLVQQRIRMLGIPMAVGFSPDGGKIYVSDLGWESVLFPQPFTVISLAFALTHIAPGLPSQITVYDAQSGQLDGPAIKTGTAPDSGVYF